MVDEYLAGALEARVVAGCANNLVTGPRAAQRLSERGAVYVPDFLANCGGLIQVDVERRGGEQKEVDSAIRAAVDRVRDILLAAEAAGRMPVEIAKQRACARLALARCGRAD